jgi:para-aminobenzoate synthetase component 1
MTTIDFIEKLNKWGGGKIPFLFLVDFEIQQPIALKLVDVNQSQILFSINGFSNHASDNNRQQNRRVTFQYVAEPINTYKAKFDFVKQRLVHGDSFLVNLTARTEIQSSFSLAKLYFLAKAKYKLFYRNEFLVFSPETFIKISKGKIFSYPMKGTIDGSIENAHEKILVDTKEMAEHITIVDLIRNDLSSVASEVKVNKFRYAEDVNTTSKRLVQISSEIEGKLPINYQSKLGDILVSLLPAGSVSGAPKKRTLEIIKEAEQEARGYYTGIFGYFDGDVLDSGVMIRYVERQGDKLFYRSGGGITAQSDLKKEYQELLDKIYVPVN